MNSTDEILERIFRAYAILSDRKRADGFKGSWQKLHSKYADMLRPIVEDAGEDATVAFREFLHDEYWSTRGYPLTAFKKQIDKYLAGGSSKVSKIQTPKPSRPQMRIQAAEMQPTTEPETVFLRAETGQGAVRRKLEALDILRVSDAALVPSCLSEIGKKLEKSDYAKVEEWHGKAVEKFRERYHREPIIITEACA